MLKKMVNQNPSQKILSFSASTSERWFYCNAYPILKARSNVQEPIKPSALEGTKAHLLAASILELQKIGKDINRNSFFLKKNIALIRSKIQQNNLEHGENLEISLDEMEEYLPDIFFYIDYVNSFIAIDKTEHHIEYQTFIPNFPKFILDSVLFNSETGELDVIDLKFGKGIPVSARGNFQLALYAYSMFFYIKVKIEKIRVHIVQPRIGFGAKISTDEYTVKELTDFVRSIIDKVRFIKKLSEKKNPFKNKYFHVSSETCGFCELKLICPKLSKEIIHMAKLNFSIIPFTPTEKLIDIYDKWRAITGFLYAVKGYLTQSIYMGEIETEKYKTVQSLSNRKWKDPKSAEKYLRKHFGDIVITKPELKSPAQVEEITGADFIKDLLIREEKDVALVPIDDTRESISILREFDKI